MADDFEATKPWPSIPEISRKREIILFTGKTGCGKSFLFDEYIKKFPRVLLMDPLQEHKNFIEFENIEDLIAHCLAHKTFHVSISDIREFPSLCHISMGLTRCVLAVEESQRFLPSRGNLDPYFLETVYRGRHRAVSILLIMQRLSTVHIEPRSQWTKIITFQQSDLNDTTWLRNTTGNDLECLENLEIGEYYEITPHTKKLMKWKNKKRFTKLEEIIIDDKEIL